ncbi:bifunctional 4-hydroxy-2-oxoglutarate aldolase/2-dehydro-3-deoxy-phosphogluconate aldolase [Paenibacillus sp. YN15]|uniref:bifunctional 4-hydroxy-2-oxoglutarate aldolase/2-dehydro-3-deoxy-phosphogluconate aldolase n=1 Tax=Paenibacillus sp. YN15 TaxID=1742774 RepID=UPI000DCD3494|nr:bifunctional 4-hydroxy-2-oxoglutarate aldolase/2-dehydro-3-deoxy-phosphogluconate aldolase [Paenibacillus sp. YN15]RAV04149.1 2-dehydro-3-deoxyphosphogluconate aldolase [Paenibacillus sp. YN15]
MSLAEEISRHFLVAIIRGAEDEKEALAAIKAMYDGGIRVLELTASTPGVMSLLERARAAMPSDLIIGIGTVLDPETARSALLAGAQFILCPIMRAETITLAKRYGAVVIPGAMTPTEILKAYELGADMVKVFPAGPLGPQYIRDIHGPLPQIPLMPTGGVNLENIADYVRAGAAAAGLGNALYQPGAGKSADKLQELLRRSQQFTAAVAQARNQPTCRRG